MVQAVALVLTVVVVFLFALTLALVLAPSGVKQHSYMEKDTATATGERQHYLPFYSGANHPTRIQTVVGSCLLSCPAVSITVSNLSMPIYRICRPSVVVVVDAASMTRNTQYSSDIIIT